MAALFLTHTSAADMTGAFTPAYTLGVRACGIARVNAAGTTIALAGGCVR